MWCGWCVLSSVIYCTSTGKEVKTHFSDITVVCAMCSSLMFSSRSWISLAFLPGFLQSQLPFPSSAALISLATLVLTWWWPQVIFYAVPYRRCPVPMDQITIKTSNPKCRLYWYLIEFKDWRYSPSCWYFRFLLCTGAPLTTFSLGWHPPPPPPPSLCE